MKKQPLEKDTIIKRINGIQDDFDIFLSAVKKVLENPQQFGLEVE